MTLHHVPSRWIGFIVSLAVLTACGKPDEIAPATPSMTVSVGKLESIDLQRRVVSAGSVVPWEEMMLGVELSGLRVAEVLVEVGDQVEKGAVLLRLDQRSLQAELRQQQAMLAQAKANQNLAAANARRARQMQEKKLMAQGDIDQLIAGEKVADAAVLSAQAALAASQLRVDFAELRAPDDGVISARMVQPGQVVTVGAELLRMIRNGRLEWRAQLAERDFVQVTLGAGVQLTDVGAPVMGKVRALSPGLDSVSRTGTVYADLPTPGKLQAGMFAQGEILLGSERVSVLPSQAVVERDGYRYAFVLGPKNLVTQTRIEVGQSFDQRSEITSGLQAEDRVVIQGAAFLSDGDLVRVVDAPATAVAGD